MGSITNGEEECNYSDFEIISIQRPLLIKSNS